MNEEKKGYKKRGSVSVYLGEDVPDGPEITLNQIRDWLRHYGNNDIGGHHCKAAYILVDARIQELDSGPCDL